MQQPLDHVLPTDSHALIGNDSDLLMMSLIADCNRVYVLGACYAYGDAIKSEICCAGQILDSYQDLPQSLGQLKVFSVEKLKKPLLNLVTSYKVPSHEEKAYLRAIRRVYLSVQSTTIDGNLFLLTGLGYYMHSESRE